jgi:hypothetical protein
MYYYIHNDNHTKEYAMRSQREAVVSTILSVLEESGIDYELNGSVPVSEALTPDMKSDVRDQIIDGFNAGEITLSEAAQAKFLPFPAELRKYVNGLVNNWIKKYKPFNCGVAYKPKNEGSRTGFADPQIKALRTLKKKAGLTAEQVSQIDEAIAERQAELKPKVEINVEDLPEEFKNLV